MTSQSKNNRLLPLTVIEAAAGGDVEAINAVLKHYAGYYSISPVICASQKKFVPAVGVFWA